jgi:hypothetical protein
MQTTYRRRRARPYLLRLEDRTVPSTLIWTGDVDANWGSNNAGNTNWNTNALPVRVGVASGSSRSTSSGNNHQS